MQQYSKKLKISTNEYIIFSKITEIILRARAREKQAKSVDSDDAKEVKANRAAER